jgi:hypothetical protein
MCTSRIEHDLFGFLQDNLNFSFECAIQKLRVAQMKHIHNVAVEYFWSQLIIWLLADMVQ